MRRGHRRRTWRRTATAVAALGVAGLAGGALGTGHDAAHRDGLTGRGRHRRLGGHRRRSSRPRTRASPSSWTSRTTTSTRPSGCRTLLASRNAPDIYFEWTGARMAQRAADGYAADLTEAVTSGPLAGIVDDGLLPAASVDGKVVLVPAHRRRHQRALVQRAAPRGARRHAAHHVGGAAGRLRHAERGGRHADRERQQGPLGGRQLAQPPRVARRRRGGL